MLAANPNTFPGCEGFIIDLEFPWMENVIGHSEVSKPAALKSGSTDTAMSVPAQRGASVNVSSYIVSPFPFRLADFAFASENAAVYGYIYSGLPREVEASNSHR